MLSDSVPFGFGGAQVGFEFGHPPIAVLRITSGQLLMSGWRWNVGGTDAEAPI